MRLVILGLIVLQFISCNGRPTKSALGAEGLSILSDSEDSYVEVEWLSSPSHGCNVVIDDVEWDSFSVCIYFDPLPKEWYYDFIGGNYSYWGCNRISVQPPDIIRNDASYSGTYVSTSLPQGRFVVITSPAPSNLKWDIDGKEYPVAACRNQGGPISLFYQSTTSSGTFSKSRIASLQLSYKGNITLNLIPVRVGEVGFFVDTITGREIYQTGDVPLIIGPDKE